VKKFVVAAALAASCIVPAVAPASIGAELKAGSKAEQSLQHRYPPYTVFAVCDQQSSRRFWCTVGGSRGHCLISGHARVTRSPWRTRLVGVNRSCY
jgi:hypothetical protein